MSEAALLIVDDDQSIRTVLRSFLQSKCFEVIDAADSEQALDWLGRRSFDLVLLDVVMPGLMVLLFADRRDTDRHLLHHPQSCRRQQR
jgi:DNA-binding response OmpR family regulator